jgi:hypothetical protein
VTRDGGVVAACVWDFTEGGPIGPFWDAAQALDPEVETGSVCPGSRAGHLADLFRAAGIGDVVDGSVAVDVEHATFEDWWEPFTLGVAPSGAYVAGLEPDRHCASSAGRGCRSHGSWSRRRPGWRAARLDAQLVVRFLQSPGPSPSYRRRTVEPKEET